MAVLIHKEVKAVAESMPGESSEAGRIRNCEIGE